MEFIESPIFTRFVKQLLTDEEYRVLQAMLAAHPGMGDVIPGAGGLRKIRWGSATQGRGKRGGVRIIYYRVRPNLISMMLIYKKSDQGNLTIEQLKAMRKFIEGDFNEGF